MEKHEFTLALAGDPNTDENLNALFEAGCDDATFGSIDGAAYANFTREADSLEQAVLGAIRQIEAVGDLRVIRIEPDDLVTAAEIAERLHVTRQQVSLCIAGQRGADKGQFPLPASHLTSKSRLWRWSEVVAWYDSPESDEAHRANWIAATNVTLASNHVHDGAFFVSYRFEKQPVTFRRINQTLQYRIAPTYRIDLIFPRIVLKNSNPNAKPQAALVAQLKSGLWVNESSVERYFSDQPLINEPKEAAV